MVKQDQVQDHRSRLALLRQEIDEGLDRYLTVTGIERSQLTIRLLQLRWEVEELQAADRTNLGGR